MQALKSKLPSLRRLIPPAFALLLAALLAILSGGVALAQSPPGEIVLVNADREFVARPIFDRRIDVLHYVVRDADTGDWVTAVYQVRGGEKQQSDIWEYPALDEQPDFVRDKAYLLVMLVQTEDGTRGDFYAVVPIYEPGRIWGKTLVAFNPARWARAFADW